MAVRPCDDARGGESTALVFPDLHSVNHLIRERRSLQDRCRGCRDVVDLQPLGRTRVGPDQIVLPADLRTREVVRRRRDRDSLVDAGTGCDAGGARSARLWRAGADSVGLAGTMPRGVCADRRLGRCARPRRTRWLRQNAALMDASIPESFWGALAERGLVAASDPKEIATPKEASTPKEEG